MIGLSTSVRKQNNLLPQGQNTTGMLDPLTLMLIRFSHGFVSVLKFSK